MACGLPVITTGWSGPADFADEQNAFLVRHSGPIPRFGQTGTIARYDVEPDIDHLVYLMRYVFEHQDEGSNIGKIASLRARAEWTWQRAAITLWRILGSPNWSEQEIPRRG
jgi:hypothetical protein